MGRTLPLIDLDESETQYIPSPNSPSNHHQVLHIIHSIKQLPSDDLHFFFKEMFVRMTSTAKEGVVDVMWSTLSLREQRLFDLPTYGQTSEDAAHLAFRVPWVRRTEPLSPPREEANTSPTSAPQETSTEIVPRRRPRQGRDFEDHLLSILMEAVFRPNSLQE